MAPTLDDADAQPGETLTSAEKSEETEDRMQVEPPARAPTTAQSRYGYQGEAAAQQNQQNQQSGQNQGNQYDGDEEIELQPAHLGTHPMAAKRPLKNIDPNVTLTLSRQLIDRLQQQAKEEGIEMAFLISELLAEAVTLRAWEIIERKSQMRGSNQQQGGGGNQGFRGGGQNQGGGGGHNRNRGHHRGGGGGGQGGGGGGPRRGQGGGQGGNAWMEDKAAFLEYVRNQEKRRR